MPARTVPLVTEEYYHIFNRGINKQPIFLNVRDCRRATNVFRYYQLSSSKLRYSKFIKLSDEEKETYWSNVKNEEDRLVEIVCYCLMPNHFHFLVKQTKDIGISTFMRKFQDSYTRYFNTRYEGIGPILQGQFKAILIEDDEQLLHLSRYIHLNPLSSNVVKDFSALKEYSWSSFPEYLGRSNIDFCNKEIVLSNFKSTEDYETFTLDRASYQIELNKIKHLLLE